MNEWDRVVRSEEDHTIEMEFQAFFETHGWAHSRELVEKCRFLYQEVRYGQRACALVGPRGSGKTFMIKAVARVKS